MLPSTASSISGCTAPPFNASCFMTLEASRSASSRERTAATCRRYLPPGADAATGTGGAGAAATGGASTATGGGATGGEAAGALATITGGSAAGRGAAGALATITGGAATGGGVGAALCVAQGRGAASAAGVCFAGSEEATMVASCHCGGEDEVAVGAAVALVATGDDGVEAGVADVPELEPNMLPKKPLTALSTLANGFDD